MSIIPLHALFTSCLIGPMLAATALAEETLRYQWPQTEGNRYAIEVRLLDHSSFRIFKVWPEIRERDSDAQQATLLLGWMNSEITTETIPVAKRASSLLGSPSSVPELSFSHAEGQQSFMTEIDSQGRCELREASQLPHLLGTVTELFFDRLPVAEEQEWLQTTNGSIRTPLSSVRRDTDPLPCTRSSTYRLTQITKATATIGKELVLLSTEQRAGGAHVELRFTQTSEFDRNHGRVNHVTGKGQLIVRDDQLQATYPIEIEAHLLSPEERIALQAKLKQASNDRAAATAAREAEARRPFTPEERADVLKQLELGERKVLSLLARKRPTESDSEISAALMRHLKTDDEYRKQQVMDALIWWGDQQTVPIFLEAIQHRSYGVRRGGLAAVIRLQATAAIPILVGQLSDQNYSVFALQTLTEFGEIAESQVRTLLANNDEKLQSQGVRILEKVGTAASLPDLKRLQPTATGVLAVQVKNAINQIEFRIQEQAK